MKLLIIVLCAASMKKTALHALLATLELMKLHALLAKTNLTDAGHVLRPGINARNVGRGTPLATTDDARNALRVH